MGYYCPQGSSKPVSCDGGKYCETPGLESPTGENLTVLVWLSETPGLEYMSGKN